MNQYVDTDLLEQLKLVCDETSFISFVEAVALDFSTDRELERAKPSNPHGPSALGWENSSVDEVLKSGVAWARDTTGRSEFAYTRKNPWQFCAWVIYAGKAYE